MRVESVGRPKRRVARSPVARIAFQWFSLRSFSSSSSCENVIRTNLLHPPPFFFGSNQIFSPVFLFIRQFLSNNDSLPFLEIFAR